MTTNNIFKFKNTLKKRNLMAKNTTQNTKI